MGWKAIKARLEEAKRATEEQKKKKREKEEEKLKKKLDKIYIVHGWRDSGKKPDYVITAFPSREAAKEWVKKQKWEGKHGITPAEPRVYHGRIRGLKAHVKRLEKRKQRERKIRARKAQRMSSLGDVFDPFGGSGRRAKTPEERLGDVFDPFGGSAAGMGSPAIDYDPFGFGPPPRRRRTSRRKRRTRKKKRRRSAEPEPYPFDWF